MDSILISPKDEKELAYITELMNNLGVPSKRVSEEETEEFELALMMKDVNTSGIIRKDLSHSKLTETQKEALKRSETDIKEKLIIIEQRIQIEEDKWLDQ